MLKLGLDDVIQIYGREYTVKTILKFQDWVEYGLSDNMWISSDDKQTALWSFCSKDFNESEYELEESGMEFVSKVKGESDCEEGDSAKYWEYVNKSTGELYSIEEWDDETETCKGNVLPPEEVIIVKQGDHKEESSILGKLKSKVGCFVLSLLGLGGMYLLDGESSSSSNIGDVFSSNSDLELLTSISASQEYQALIFEYPELHTTEGVAEEIIELCDGAISEVQNAENCDAVAMNSESDFCLVYKSTDGTPLIHYCRREYLYNYLDEPLYKADSLTENFYRAYYTNVMYPADSAANYHSGNRHHYHRSLYGIFFYDRGNRYHARAQSVRQASVARRNSSGGGHGGGGK